MMTIMALGACLAACGRFEQIGKEPEFTPTGSAGPAQIAGPTASRVALTTPPPQQAVHGKDRASLWRSGPSSLFGDDRAKRQGDILTVIIEIDDSASLDNTSSRTRSSADNLGIPQLFGVPQILDRILPDGASSTNPADVGATSSYVGQGNVSRGEQITLRIAATVVDVLPNDHLVIAGTQQVRVNYELRDLQISGIVRPQDISRQNQITYDKIAGARIAYGGRGQVSDVQQPRYGQQALDIVLPF
ncbi:MAG: flagellar basal body L-ring protein FlgH [Pseudomonadota bacterium]